MLSKNVIAFIDSKPYSIKNEIDQDREEYIITTVIQDVPLEFGLFAGDFVHCLRGSLDHLAWTLAAINTPKPTTLSERICFPIFAIKDAQTPRRIAECTKGIDSGAVAVIEALQPYHYGTDYKTTHLWRLNKLWNIDKHRHLAFHSAVLNTTFPNIPQDARSAVILEANDDGHRLRVPLSLVHQDVKFDPLTDLRICFGDETEGFRVTILDFQEMYEFIRDVVFRRLEQYLK